MISWAPCLWAAAVTAKCWFATTFSCVLGCCGAEGAATSRGKASGIIGTSRSLILLAYLSTSFTGVRLPTKTMWTVLLGSPYFFILSVLLHTNCLFPLLKKAMAFHSAQVLLCCCIPYCSANLHCSIPVCSYFTLSSAVFPDKLGKSLSL